MCAMATSVSNVERRAEEFHRDGFLILHDFLPQDLVARLLDGLNRAFSEPLESEEGKLRGELVARIWRPRMFERGVEFEELVDYPPTIELMEKLLGHNCHLIAMNSLKTGPGDGISGWHADEEVRVPMPAEAPLDPRVQAPCFVVNMNYYLTDVDEDLGPTQLVPGSHRSGRQPLPSDMDANGNPTYHGHAVVSATGKAGTAVMWHDQVWHRGAVNRSKDGVRWVQQAAYGKRWISQRFYPFVGYDLPAPVRQRANPKRLRLFGFHQPDNYG